MAKFPISIKNNEKKFDSSRALYISCIIDYFIENQSHYKIDTVWVDNEWVIEPIKLGGILEYEATYFMSRMEIYDRDTNYHIITKFYTFDELKGKCISGVFRYESVEEWANGKKHGKWKYWNMNGIKIREIEYDQGKKLRETTY